MPTASPGAQCQCHVALHAIGFGLGRQRGRAFDVDLESLVTGAGGVAGVCAWVIVRQDRLIHELRRDLAAQQDASRAQVESVYSRLLDSMSELGSALGALERAVVHLGERSRRNGQSHDST